MTHESRLLNVVESKVQQASFNQLVSTVAFRYRGLLSMLQLLFNTRSTHMKTPIKIKSIMAFIRMCWWWYCVRALLFRGDTLSRTLVGIILRLSPQHSYAVGKLIPSQEVVRDPMVLTFKGSSPHKGEYAPKCNDVHCFAYSWQGSIFRRSYTSGDVLVWSRIIK